MTIEFKLPELGENITSGDVVNVLVHEGDQLAANDGVVELETDKAVVEIPCPHAGRVAKVHVHKGETIKVGQTLLTIEAEAEAAPEAKPATPEAKPVTPPPKAEADEASPKEEPAATPPKETSATSQPKADAAAAAAPAPPPSPASGPIPAGPTARRVARELGVDLHEVQGSGKHGRITPEDVQARGAAPRAAAQPMTPPVVPPGEPGKDAWGPIRCEKISRIRRTIAEQMIRSAGTIPHVTNCDDADVTDLDQVRQSVPSDFLGENVRLSLTPFVMKAVAESLLRHPLLNASYNDEHDQVVYKQYVNLGIAVDTPRGLVVPNIRGADAMTVAELARSLAAIAAKARAADFAVDDLRGGTFTISNLGAVGGTYSTPIINYPEAAILLIGRARWMPVVRGEGHARIEPRLMMPLSLSYDHRLVDGAAAGRFLNDVIRYLQSPGMLLMT